MTDPPRSSNQLPTTRLGGDTRLNLASGAVHIYLCAPERQSPAGLERAWSVLDEGERQQAERFVFAIDRLHYTVAHGLLRLSLARYLVQSARELSFVRTGHGRPELRSLGGQAALRFSLSHTRGLVGCAVTQVHDIGFDLEWSRRSTLFELADRYFAASEVAGLRELAGEARNDRFFDIWTLKEAYLKGRGLGLALPLSAFAVEPRAAGEAELTLRPADDPTPWTLRRWSFGEHRAALAFGAPLESAQVTLFRDQQL